MFKKRPAASLQDQLNKLTDHKDFNDPTEWRLSIDKNGNGSAFIRFLPNQDEKKLPFIKIYSHGFKNNGKWFIENCPTTIGLSDACPVCAANSALWNSGVEANQNIARERKRKLSYWANIVVVRDDANPENNGKVFKYRFGPKILEKIQSASKGDPDLGKAPIDVTNVFTGANFLLRAKTVNKQLNYDDSDFGQPQELFNGDGDELDRVWSEMHDIDALIAPENFKSLEELTKHYERVVPTAAAPKTKATAGSAQAMLETASNVTSPLDLSDSGDGELDDLDDLLKDLTDME